MGEETVGFVEGDKASWEGEQKLMGSAGLQQERGAEKCNG